MEISQRTRSYSLTSELDGLHTVNGRCPNYALTWHVSDNSKHWPAGHDYYLGNRENIIDGTQELREILSEKLVAGKIPKHIVFCDLDGVLADFAQGVRNKFKKNIDEIKPSLMWGVINKSATFFDTLPWMPRGKELWEHIKQYHPIILTGVPPGSSTAAEQKIRWCKRELGEDVQVITCTTKEKPKYCLSKSILIDDRTDNLNAWNKKGGKFFLYDEEHLDTILERIDRHMVADLPSP